MTLYDKYKVGDIVQLKADDFMCGTIGVLKSKEERIYEHHTWMARSVIKATNDGSWFKELEILEQSELHNPKEVELLIVIMV